MARSFQIRPPVPASQVILCIVFSPLLALAGVLVDTATRTCSTFTGCDSICITTSSCSSSGGANGSMQAGPRTLAGEELLWRVLGTGKCFRGLLRMTQWVPEVALFKTASGVVGSSWKVPPQISIPRAACLGIKVYTLRKILAPGAGVPQYQSGKRQAR